MKPYPEYKDSGIEWIGEIPEHWDVKRLKFVGESIIGITYSPNEVSSESLGILVLRSSNIQSGSLAFHDCVYVSKKIEEKYLTRDGDILLCARNGSAHLVGKSAYIDIENKGHTFGAFMTVVRSQLGKYLYQFFNSQLFKSQTGLFSTSTINQLTANTLNNLSVTSPPLPEQKQIAKYLDHKTTQIDSLIEKKKRLIELLKEERTAVINHAVTKGLDANVPMKDSGIEWLGEIPAHWELKKIKYATKIFRGKFTHRPRNDPELYNGKYPFIQTGDVSQSDKFINQYYQTLNDKGYKASKEFPKGTVVMTIAANIGDVAILNFDACFPDSIVGFHPNKIISSIYLYYALKASKEGFLQTAIQNTQFNLNIDRIGSLCIGIPDTEEQELIVKHIEKEASRIDSIISKSEREIDLLQEYRTALISEVVTGKIDVREEKI